MSSSSKINDDLGISRSIPVATASWGNDSAPNNSSDSNGGFQSSGGLFEYWRIVVRRKGTVVLLAAIGGLLGFLITIPQKPIYQSHTTLEVLSTNDNFLNQKQLSPINENGFSTEVTDIQTQIRVLQSESLLEQVVEKLSKDSSSSPQKPPFWRKLLNLPEQEPKNEKREALGYAVQTLRVRSIPQTRIIEVTVDSPLPQAAASFANMLGAEYIEQHLEAHYKATEKTGDWLGHQLDDMRIKLERSADALQQYARQAGLMFSSDEKTNISEEKLRQVQETLSTAEGDRIAKQSRWEMASTSPPDALPDVLNDSALREYQAKLTELNRQIAELRTTYTTENARVKRVQAQVGPIHLAFDKARADILERIKNEYDEALRREKLLVAQYENQRGIVTGEGEKSIQYNILKREVDSNRQLYDAMLQQMKAATLASALQASNIRVVDPAKIPPRPYRPNVPNSAAIGFLAGSFLGIALVVMQERADRSIQQPGDSPMLLNLPELGIVPSESSSRLRVPLVIEKIDDSATHTKNGTNGDRSMVELVTWEQKPSPLAESFRATLVSILFSGESGNRPRTIGITSASPAEGKSTIVSNLGIAIAEVSQRVLLIDADLRKPRLHAIFGLSNHRGLSDLLRSKDSIPVAMDGVIQQTQIPNLYVLPSGGGTFVATSLLYSDRMRDLICVLQADYETILIDTPPMLQIPDARVIGRMVDRMILVMRAGKTTRSAALAARQRFLEDGTPILGTILNDWNAKRSPNGYYGSYGGYYGGYYNGYSQRKPNV